MLGCRPSAPPHVISGKITPMANRLKELRDAAGFTQQSLADALGVHLITVGKLERGETQMTVAKMEQYAAVLGVSPRELMDEPDEASARLTAIETKLDKATAKINRLMAHLGIGDT